MSAQEDFEKIEQFLLGKLPEEEAAAIRERMDEDSQFKAEVDQTKQIIGGIIIENRKTLLKRLQERDEKEAEIIPFYSRKEFYYIAASLSILVIAAIVFFLPSQNNEELFLSYYEPYEEINIARPRGGGDEFDIKSSARESYEKGEFGESIEIILESEVAIDDEEGYLIMGLANMALKNYEEAKINFELARKIDQEANEPDQDNSDAIRWYLALIYLRLDKSDKAVDLLAELTMSENRFTDQARKLLTEL